MRLSGSSYREQQKAQIILEARTIARVPCLLEMIAGRRVLNQSAVDIVCPAFRGPELFQHQGELIMESAFGSRGLNLIEQGCGLCQDMKCVVKSGRRDFNHDAIQ